jgi:late competence protein required for DNA uptake (superfamily II DNA/RNA helicase)
MVDCPTCGKPLNARTVRCSRCEVELHRGCAKKTMGKYYCKRCYREGKKLARYERMAQRTALGQSAPKKMW